MSVRQKRAIDDWFDDYSSYHQNPTNKIFHWICIPLIMLSLLGLLWEIPLPAAIGAMSAWLNCATLFVAVSLIFYLRISTTIAIGMLLCSAVMLALISACDVVSPGFVWRSSLVIFVVAWVGQFIGHKIEGKKPAFIEDLQFLLIGPAWLLGFVYRKVGIPY